MLCSRRGIPTQDRRGASRRSIPKHGFGIASLVTLVPLTIWPSPQVVPSPPPLPVPWSARMPQAEAIYHAVAPILLAIHVRHCSWGGGAFPLSGTSRNPQYDNIQRHTASTFGHLTVVQLGNAVLVNEHLSMYNAGSNRRRPVPPVTHSRRMLPNHSVAAGRKIEDFFKTCCRCCRLKISHRLCGLPHATSVILPKQKRGPTQDQPKEAH